MWHHTYSLEKKTEFKWIVAYQGSLLLFQSCHEIEAEAIEMRSRYTTTNWVIH